ncbi:phosphoribosyl-ATP diphosphatase [Vulcanisaeta souniana]|uniref:phosphoribosyl-ATP diphosphatase n=1 Tax=Vulcanisaeta souniana TaxID=164452 RepID=UPI0006D0DE9E|nr:phosphoribosyl-ATP diphosphatase [Vulcanisaeta souniana]
MVCQFLDELQRIIDERIEHGGDSRSYTRMLVNGGVDLISKKVGEEAVEVVVAAMRDDRGGWVVRETADLMYHLLVLLRFMGIKFDDICEELVNRHTARVGAHG